MNHKTCHECDYYCWIEDYYDDGSYEEIEYCDLDCNYPCHYSHAVCEHFCQKS